MQMCQEVGTTLAGHHLVLKQRWGLDLAGGGAIFNAEIVHATPRRRDAAGGDAARRRSRLVRARVTDEVSGFRPWLGWAGCAVGLGCDKQAKEG